MLQRFPSGTKCFVRQSRRFGSLEGPERSKTNEKAIELEGYTDDQLAVLHGDGEKSEIEYRLAWARKNLKNLGAVTNSSRGVWTLTEYGREAREAELIERDKEWRKELATKRAQKVLTDQVVSDAAEGGEAGTTPGEDWRVELLRC